jgi:hypothetical protein
VSAALAVEVSNAGWKFPERITTGNQMTGSKAASVTDRRARRINPMQQPRQFFTMLAVLLLAACTLSAQDAPPPAAASPDASPATQAPTYTPKYHSDPAHSDSEFAALAYMRGVMRAQMLYNKHYGHYAASLTQLVHIQNFTQRMVNPDRGDYTAGFKGKKDGFFLTMTPKNLDAQHRSFYAEEDGKIHADESKAADGNSPVVETHRW